MIQSKIAAGVAFDPDVLEYLKAAQQGHADAQFRAALILRLRSGSENREAMLRWLTKAAVQEHAEAQLQLAFELAQATSAGGIQDFTEWLRRAAENGSADAQFRMGLLYYSGTNGFEKDSINCSTSTINCSVSGSGSGKGLICILACLAESMGVFGFWKLSEVMV